MFDEAAAYGGFPEGGYLVAIDDGYGGVGGYVLAAGEGYGYEEGVGYEAEPGPGQG